VIEQSNLYGYDIGGLFFKIIYLVFLALAFVAADVKSALHKKRKDGKKAPLQRLTTMQRVYVSRLILKHGDNHEAMSRDIKLNRMQHPPGILKHLCERFHKYEKLSAFTET
jgi:hypothetical protein